MTTKVKHIANNVVTDSQINLSTIDSGEIAEGSNLYFTDARVDSRLSGGSVGAITHTQGYTQTAGTWQKQGTVGNVSFSSDGNNIAFSRNGPNYVDTPGASSSLNFRTGSSYATAATIDSSQNTTFNGDVTITGQLSITGNIDQYNVTDLDVTDKTITLGSGQTEANSGGSGIVIDGSNASILWDESNGEWDFNKNIRGSGTIQAQGALISTLTSSGGSFLVATHTGNEQWSFDARSGSGSTDYVDFGIAGSTRCMTWQEDGNVGIGTTNPSSKIHLHTTGSEDIALGFQNSERYYKIHTDGGNLRFTDVSAGLVERMSILANGNVGIGTASPATNLHVHTTSSHSEIRVSSSASGNGTVPAVSLNNTAVEWGMGILADNHLHFRENTASYASRLTIADGGNVGIGTTNPVAPLHVVSGTTLTAKFEGATNAYMDFTDGSVTTRFQNSGGFFIGTESNHNVSIKTGGTGVKMTVEAGGKVGIGTTAPSKKLHVEDSSGYQLQLDGGNNFWNVGAGWSGYYDGSFLIANNTGDKLVIDSNGNVGIGTTAPGARLHVSIPAIAAGTDLQKQGIVVSTPFTSGYQFQSSGLLSGYDGALHGTAIGMVYENPGYALTFFTNDNTSGLPIERVRIDDSGNVGIGTNNPGCALDIERTSGWAEVHFNGASGGDLILQDNGVNIGEIYAGVGHGMVLKSYASQDMHFLTNASATPKMIIKSDGTKITNNVREYYERIFLTNNVAYTFDIDVKSIGASGQILEVFAGYTHYSTTYGAVIKQVWSQRSTAQSDVVIINNTVNHSTSQAGAWTFTYVDADTVRLTKSAGTYGGSGWGYILIRSPD